MKACRRRIAREWKLHTPKEAKKSSPVSAGSLEATGVFFDVAAIRRATASSFPLPLLLVLAALGLRVRPTDDVEDVWPH